MTELPERAQVVVIGGGIVGASVAYHLAHLGFSDLVLLEQGQLSSGTTWHAAGLVGQLRATESGTRLVQYSATLYQSLEAETGLSTGYKGATRPQSATAATRAEQDDVTTVKPEHMRETTSSKPRNRTGLPSALRR